MDRRNFLKSAALAVAGAGIAGTTIAQTLNSAPAQDTSAAQIGKLTTAEFQKLNKKGAADVAAVEPTSAKLSEADAAMMRKVAAAGMMQLELSKLAAEKATDPDVRMLANAEIQEQSGLKMKLKEIAAAKNMTMTDSPDDETTAMLAKLRAMSGAEFDRAYVRESGVEGHEMLDKLMIQTKSQGGDASLKALAIAAHPLVQTHLDVARVEAGQLAKA